MFNVNLRGAFYCCKFAVPHMRDNGGGSVVNIGSINGIQALPNLVAYGAAKGGLLGMTRTLAGAYAANRIRFNYIIPGWVLSEGGNGPATEPWCDGRRTPGCGSRTRAWASPNPIRHRLRLHLSPLRRITAGHRNNHAHRRRRDNATNPAIVVLRGLSATALTFLVFHVAVSLFARTIDRQHEVTNDIKWHIHDNEAFRQHRPQHCKWH